MASPTIILLSLFFVALILNHLYPAKGHENHDEPNKHPQKSQPMNKLAINSFHNHIKFGRSSDSRILPMPYGTKAPLMPGVGWGCPCDGMRCGCDTAGCGCPYSLLPPNNNPHKYSYVQPPWECPCDPSCRCDQISCGCSPPLDFGCPPSLGFCDCFPDNAYCPFVPPGVGNFGHGSGGITEPQIELDKELASEWSQLHG